MDNQFRQSNHYALEVKLGMHSPKENLIKPFKLENEKPDCSHGFAEYVAYHNSMKSKPSEEHSGYVIMGLRDIHDMPSWDMKNQCWIKRISPKEIKVNGKTYVLKE